MKSPPKNILINLGFSYLFEGNNYNDRPNIKKDARTKYTSKRE